MTVATQKATTTPGPQPLYRIRPARRGDTEAICGLLGELGYPNAVDSSMMNWVISHPEMDLFVAADAHDRAIGVITLSHRPQLRMKGRVATIDELIVSPSWRRRGVGRELLKRAVDRARVLSVKRLELTTHQGRGEYVKAFYQACGFFEADSSVLRLTELDFQRR